MQSLFTALWDYLRLCTLKSMTAFFVCFSYCEFCVCVRRGFFLLLTTHTYLMATKRQHFLSTSCFSSLPLVVFFSLKANTAASVERRTNRISLIRPGLSCICSPENTAVATYEFAEIGCGRCDGKICHNLLPDRNLEAKGEKTC